MGRLITFPERGHTSRISEEIEYLIQEDGDSFEQARSHLISEAIDTSANPERMRRLQWRIDGIINAQAGMGAAIKLSTMMFDSCISMNEVLRNPAKDDA